VQDVERDLPPHRLQVRGIAASGAEGLGGEEHADKDLDRPQVTVRQTCKAPWDENWEART
jgi:hypothetical protein